MNTGDVAAINLLSQGAKITIRYFLGYPAALEIEGITILDLQASQRTCVCVNRVVEILNSKMGEAKEVKP